MIRTGRSCWLLLGALVFVVMIGSLGYTQRNEWDFPQIKQKTPVSNVDADLHVNPHEADIDAAKSKTEATPGASTSQKAEEEEKRIMDLLFDIHKDIVKPDSEIYQPYGATEWKLSEDAHFGQSLEQDLCIIDIDNRPFDERGQAFSDSMSWDHLDQLHGISLGILNHWLYAKLHNYKYYFVTFETPEHRRSSWEKPYIISKLLQKHKTCIYIDSDAIFYHLDLPFEWLMNYWKINPRQHSFALSWDPDFKHNRDQFDQVYFNTGFIITQNNKKTFDMLRDWDECTNEGGKYPGCEDFRFNSFGRPTDQGGFGTYVRYDYEENIRDLPCSEANGFPEDGSDCKGKFIRHMWSGKDTLIKEVTGHQFPSKFLEVAHKKFMEEKDSFYFHKTDL